MNQIENKVLGKDKKTIQERIKKDVFDPKIVWKISKQGCGQNLANGAMAHEMLSFDGKKKALKGNKKIYDNGFVFERLN